MTGDAEGMYEVPPNDHARLVKQALENLYDLPALDRHPFARQDAPSSRSIESAGQRLRSRLMAAIETLNPGPTIPFRAPRARTFQLLHLHYVEGLTIHETARELGLSERQTYRDLRAAEESVAAVLRPQRTAPEPSASTTEDALSTIKAEMARLEMSSLPLDLGAVLLHAQRAVERLADQRGVALVTAAPSEPVLISADPLLAQQLVTHLLSQIIQQMAPGDLDLSLLIHAQGARITMLYTPASGPAEALAASLVATQSAERLGWQLSGDIVPDGRFALSVDTSRSGPTVLVIDDNQGLVELLQRYLTGQAVRVWTATDSNLGFDMACQLVPAAIILDVMMPEVDGWELLQRLRAHPSAANIPVVICSVFNDPELAFSLGASAFIAKPVDRSAVLAALSRVGVL